MNVANEIFFEMVRKRSIFIRGEIESSLSANICDAVVYLNTISKDPINVFIDSGGGSIPASFDVYDVLKNSSAPVVATVVRRANSMAAFVLQACGDRRIYRHSDIHLHWFTVGDKYIDVLADNKKRDKMLKPLFEKWEYMISVFSKRTGQSKKIVIRWFGRESDGNTFSAEEALKLGLVDKIIG